MMDLKKSDRRVVEGFRLPDDEPHNQNELQWLKFLRIIFGDNVPPPPMNAARALRTLHLDGV